MVCSVAGRTAKGPTRDKQRNALPGREGQVGPPRCPDGERGGCNAPLTAALWNGELHTPPGPIKAIGLGPAQMMQCNALPGPARPGPATGGRLQPVLMRPTPQLSVKTRGGGGGGGAGGSSGGGSAGGCRGGILAVGGVSQGGGACARPTITTCIPPGGCVSGGLGVRRYVCDDSAFSSLPRRKS